MLYLTDKKLFSFTGHIAGKLKRQKVRAQSSPFCLRIFEKPDLSNQRSFPMREFFETIFPRITEGVVLISDCGQSVFNYADSLREKKH